MNLDNIIIKKEKVQGKDSRWDYEKIKPDDYVGETVHITSAVLNDVTVKDKVSKAGNEYTDKQSILNLYNDTEQLQMVFFIKHFNNYDEDTDTLILRSNNPLLNLLNYLGDDDSNKMTIDYKPLQELIKNITSMDFTIYEYMNKDFTNTSFTVDKISLVSKNK